MPMMDQVAAAIDRQDYKTAARLLKQWQAQSPDNPWIRLYWGRLQEAAGKWQAAAQTYRALLPQTTHPRLMQQARDGLQRLQAQEQQQRQQAIAQANADPANAGLGVLVLQPIDAAAKQAAAQSFARIMKLDPYTARLHLPSRGWRLYRTGTVGEVCVYATELQAAGIPVFWMPLAAAQQIRVFRVQCLQSVSPPTVICANEAGQLGSLTFAWSEVNHQVAGLLPIFEDVVDVGVYNRLKRKEKTQDYAQVLDLHLPQRRSILRFCDRSYQFQQGVVFAAAQDGIPSATIRNRWNQMVEFLGDRLTAPLWSEFTSFGETALEFMPLLKEFPAYIDLFRKEPTPWDAAFQLYSTLVFYGATRSDDHPPRP